MNVYARRDGKGFCFAVQVRHRMYVGGKIVPEGDYVILRGIARLIRTKEEFERVFEPAQMVVYNAGGEVVG